jgi:malate dehydrogenase
MVGGFPRKEGMERKDVMSKNVSIYKAQASALEAHAAPNCKVLATFQFFSSRLRVIMQ